MFKCRLNFSVCYIRLFKGFTWGLRRVRRKSPVVTCQQGKQKTLEVDGRRNRVRGVNTFIRNFTCLPEFQKGIKESKKRRRLSN